jgi:hypothetical protein
MTVPDSSCAVRTPIVVPAGELLLMVRLLMVIVMSLSGLAAIRLVLWGRFPASVTVSRPTPLYRRVDVRLNLQSSVWGKICQMGGAGCGYSIQAEEAAAWQNLEMPGNMEWN